MLSEAVAIYASTPSCAASRVRSHFKTLAGVTLSAAEVEKLTQPGVVLSIFHEHPALEGWRQRSQPIAHIRGSRIDEAFHAISAEPCVVKQRADIVVAKNNPGLQRWIIKDGPLFSEILEVGEWIVQLLRNVEEKFLAFSEVGHIPSCGEMT
jgi:hypothetical protein